MMRVSYVAMSVLVALGFGVTVSHAALSAFTDRPSADPDETSLFLATAGVEHMHILSKVRKLCKQRGIPWPSPHSQIDGDDFDPEYDPFEDPTYRPLFLEIPKGRVAFKVEPI